MKLLTPSKNRLRRLRQSEESSVYTELTPSGGELLAISPPEGGLHLGTIFDVN